MQKVMDQGWVWGRVGGINVVGMCAWGREPEIDHGQISMVLCDNKVWQGLCGECCQYQHQWS